MEEFLLQARVFWDEADRETRAAIIVTTLGFLTVLFERLAPPTVHSIRIVE